MRPNVSTTLSAPVALLALELLTALPAAAAATEAEAETIADEQVSPTSLAVAPQIPYERATLQIVGPEGYEVRKSFVGGAALVADLLGDRAQVVSGQREERKQAAVAPASMETAVLPDGRYRYEAVLVDASGEQQVVSGLFFVVGGMAISQEAKRAQFGAKRDELADQSKTGHLTPVTGEGLTSVTAPYVHATDGIWVYDGQNDGRTFLELQSDFPVFSAWSIDNQNGDLDIGVPGITPSVFVDGGTRNVGIGTTAPARWLHIHAPVVQQRLSSSLSGLYKIDFNVGQEGLWLNDNNDQNIVKFNHAAPANRLVVTGTGVGIDTDHPGGSLHIFGAASADVFNAVGPDPAPGGNALNFGYSGGTFGVGSGFFNVRPEGAAPNPALYFATGDVDRMLIDNQGFLGVHLDGVLGPGFNPAHPIHSQTSGAHLTAGGIWTNASSRELKEDIAPLGAETALEVLRRLEPVSFRYKVEPQDEHVGFIAEEVPELVANPDRETLSPMDIVAVLTRVVQEQQRAMDEQRREQERAIAALARRVEELEATSNPE